MIAIFEKNGKIECISSDKSPKEFIIERIVEMMKEKTFKELMNCDCLNNKELVIVEDNHVFHKDIHKNFGTLIISYDLSNEEIKVNAYDTESVIEATNEYIEENIYGGTLMRPKESEDECFRFMESEFSKRGGSVLISDSGNMLRKF